MIEHLKEPNSCFVYDLRPQKPIINSSHLSLRTRKVLFIRPREGIIDARCPKKNPLKDNRKKGETLIVFDGCAVWLCIVSIFTREVLAFLFENSKMFK